MGMALAAPSAMGAFTFANGDLILGFQATSGIGSDKNVFLNLGSGTSYRDNPNVGAIGNIGATLTLAFGANWYSRSDLYFGVVGNLNQQPNSGFGFRDPVNGDPSRTFYLSTPTTLIGAGALYAANAFPSASLGTGGTNLSGLEGILPGLITESDGAAVLDKTAQPVEWNNSWTKWNATPGAGADPHDGARRDFEQAGMHDSYPPAGPGARGIWNARFVSKPTHVADFFPQSPLQIPTTACSPYAPTGIRIGSVR